MILHFYDNEEKDSTIATGEDGYKLAKKKREIPSRQNNRVTRSHTN